MADDELIIERERRWVKSLSPEQRKKPTIFCMDRRFTPEQVLEEMEKDTAIGKVFKQAEAKMLERTLARKRMMGL